MNHRVWIALALLLPLFTPAAAQVKGPITLSVDVPSGKWKALRLRNLPTDAMIAVEVQTSRDVIVAFVDGTEYRRYPAVQRPLFSGRVEKQMSFSVTTVVAGDYFVVFDNLSGRESRAVTVKVRASRGARRDPAKETLHPPLAPIRLQYVPSDHSTPLIARMAGAYPLSLRLITK